MTEADERRERMRRYIGEQVAQGPAHLRALLIEESEKVLGLTAALSEADAAFQPAPEEWSTSQVLQHLVGSYSRNRERIALLSAGRAYDGPPSRPGQLPERPLGPFAEVRRLYAEARDAIVSLVDSADPTSNLQLTTDHAVFGAMNWPEWAVFTLHVHARAHVDQIEKNLAALAARGA
jgi:hypothetical protein